MFAAVDLVIPSATSLRVSDVGEMFIAETRTILIDGSVGRTFALQNARVDVSAGLGYGREHLSLTAVFTPTDQFGSGRDSRVAHRLVLNVGVDALRRMASRADLVVTGRVFVIHHGTQFSWLIYPDVSFLIGAGVRFGIRD
jgi:hypothetical protein